MKKTNKEILVEKLNSIDYKMGCYDTMIESLTKLQLGKILDMLQYGSLDVLVNYKRKPYICEIFHVDDEIDFNLISKDAYIKQYGVDIYNERKEERW